MAKLLLLRQPKLWEKASMFSHMGLTASPPPGKEKSVIYNGAGQAGAQNEAQNRGGQGQLTNGVSPLQKQSTQRRKELGQKYKDLDQKTGQDQKEPGHCGPFMVAGAARTDNEAATK